MAEKGPFALYSVTVTPVPNRRFKIDSQMFRGPPYRLYRR
jgi:hypothetical protein